jgi:F0F1-type ATP synthase membrane subunit c/vacuolar-type H+-ATPase subunit K
MTKDNCQGERISRRVMLAGTTLALGIGATGAAVGRAAAQSKIAQAAAKYQNTPKGQQSCAVCVNFQPPNACKFVDGTISPKGWCMLFAPKT